MRETPRLNAAIEAGEDWGWKSKFDIVVDLAEKLEHENAVMLEALRGICCWCGQTDQNDSVVYKLPYECSKCDVFAAISTAEGKQDKQEAKR